MLWTLICISLGFYRTHAIAYWNRRLPYSEIFVYMLRILNVYPCKCNLCELALSSHPVPLNISRNCWQRLNMCIQNETTYLVLSRTYQSLQLYIYQFGYKCCHGSGLMFYHFLSLLLSFSQCHITIFSVLYNLWIISLFSTAVTFSTCCNLID